MTRIVIIGGVAGGASAAARARRMDEHAEIIMLERGEFVSFANCGLPYHIGGEIESRNALLLQTPDSFKQRFNVDVRVFSEVVAIDRFDKTVTVKPMNGESYTLTYDKLLLSPGAAPVKPPISGIDNPHVFTLRNIADMDAILAVMATQKPRHATVVGGGFIGLEMAEALKHRGLNVALVELSAQVMAPVDPEMANMLHQKLVSHGIELHLNTGLEAVTPIEQHAVEAEAMDQYDVAEPAQHALKLTLSRGQLQTDVVILAIGVRPETLLVSAAGIALGERGGIKVNSSMQTSDPDIYAVGDAVETADFVTGDAALVPLAGPANRQGRIAADNMLGGDKHYQGTQGTAICKLFDMAIASTGHNEKSLKRLGINYEKVYVHAASHASYYPGAHPVTLKLLFAPVSGKILGAQAAGIDGIDKRIDVLAVAQRAGLSVRELQDLELTYAPPFGSARDVINQAGMVATNVLDGVDPVCQVEDVLAMTDEQLLLDVRNPPELTKIGAFPNAINIPLDQLRQRLDELPKDKEILVTCMVGLRGHVASRMLQQHGFTVKNLTGGYKTYQMSTAQY
ncbi:CoA-disulfide reductase [Shewanella mangrovi]|uniref:CoA-disulfide reductase n=1 Tax=Shewanella mangrovi TaxID=1515746 RepID=A0A094JIL1_9GAMM|nr:FAD-dependent oxidoreductase [Shewanella mangrovi]KFZ37859.1 CoA-disulfide reductase [Shewanella mangrovi]